MSKSRNTMKLAAVLITAALVTTMWVVKTSPPPSTGTPSRPLQWTTAPTFAAQYHQRQQEEEEEEGEAPAQLKRGDRHATVAAVRKKLATLGYVHKHGVGVGGDGAGDADVVDEALELALQLYQRSFGLEPTASLDAATRQSLRTPRCGREDVRNGVPLMLLPRSRSRSRPPPPPWTTAELEEEEHMEVVLEHETWSLIGKGGRMWRSTLNISFAFGRSFRQLSALKGTTAAEMRAAIADAFDTWARVVPLNFYEADADADVAHITIDIVGGEHGDGEPFDGPLGVLSHAFPPEDGRFHLDSAELWTTSADDESLRLRLGLHPADVSRSVDVQTVALHEIGHLIGLDHSNDASSVMFPAMPLRVLHRLLAQDDIDGATALYGPRYERRRGSARPSLRSDWRSLSRQRHPRRPSASAVPPDRYGCCALLVLLVILPWL